MQTVYQLVLLKVQTYGNLNYYLAIFFLLKAPDSSLDEISASIIASLREELSPAEKLLKAIERNPS